MFCQGMSDISRTSDHFTTPTHGTFKQYCKQSSSETQLPTQIIHLEKAMSPERLELIHGVRRRDEYINESTDSCSISSHTHLPAHCYTSTINTMSSPKLTNTIDVPSNYCPSHQIGHPQKLSDPRNFQPLASTYRRFSDPKFDKYRFKNQEPFSQKTNVFTREHYFTQHGTPPTYEFPKRVNTYSPHHQSRVFANKSGDSYDNSHSGTFNKSQTLNRVDIKQHLTGYGTTPDNCIHHKAVRSSSYPIQLYPQSCEDTSISHKRQSLQLFYSSKSIFDNCTLSSTNDSHNLSQSTNGNTELLDKHMGNDILPNRGCCHNQCLQRTLSHEPIVHQVKYVVLESTSCGEIESEYVTLDQRYNLHDRCQLSKATSQPASFSQEHLRTRLSSSLPVNESVRPIDHMYTLTTNNHVTNKDPYFATSEPVRPCNKINLTTSNTASECRKQMPKRQSISGTLKMVVENCDSVLSALNSTTSAINSSGLRDGSKGSHASSSMKPKNSGYRRVESVVMTRWKSLPDLQNEGTSFGTGHNRNYSDDEDGDHFGFLSYPVSFSSSCSSAAMNKAKAKSPSPGNRMLPKRWRSKTKAIPAVSSTVAMWTPGHLGSCAWSSVSGRKVQLRPVSILTLTEPERMVLQKIAQSKLQSMDIGCPVSIPNENAKQRIAKKTSLSLKRRSKSVNTSSLDTLVKEGTASGLVFGIPLIKCLMNDRELDKRRRRGVAPGSSFSMKMRTDSSENLQASRCARKSSSSSQGSLDIEGGMVSQKTEASSSHKRAASTDSLSESESSRNTSSSLIDALSLSTSNPASRLSSLAMDGGQLGSQGVAQVPYVVKACFKHIETYGLQTLGIFRVGCSKKRVKQLREEFDSGRNVRLIEEHNPHDVGALLKEYFRDLPDPLLTRELYLPFLHAERIKDEHKKHLALSLLISMLPVANRDTLWALLQFLATVSQHAPDHTDDKGEMVSGNKMDAHNLATLFGPNIIHRTKPEKSSDKEMMSESAERVEQSKEIIEVVKDMIDNHHELYEISGSLRDEVLRLLIESNQEVTDKILRYIANQNQIETDPESMCSVFEDSPNSPMLYRSMNSDADLLAFAQRQATESHRQLRVTKSANDSLDSPVIKPRVPILSESQAFSPASKDNHRATPFNSVPSSQQFSSNHNYPSPVSNRVPVLRVYNESTNSEITFPGRSTVRSLEYPNSEGFNQSLNIPQPMYFRKNSSSSTSSDLSCFNGFGGSENGLSGQWILPTPPSSRNISPKPLFQSASSSTTLVASSAPSLSNYLQAHDSDYENNPPVGSAEWERDRWKLWEKIAAHKKNMETEQETLV